MSFSVLIPRDVLMRKQYFTVNSANLIEMHSHTEKCCRNILFGLYSFFKNQIPSQKKAPCHPNSAFCGVNNCSHPGNHQITCIKWPRLILFKISCLDNMSVYATMIPQLIIEFWTLLKPTYKVLGLSIVNVALKKIGMKSLLYTHDSSWRVAIWLVVYSSPNLIGVTFIHHSLTHQLICS